MESQPVRRAPRDEMPDPELSPESSATTRFTPDSDSDESDLEMGELSESFKLQKREKSGVDHAADDEDEERYHDAPGRRASVSTVQSYQLYTPDEERAVVRKFDKRLVLFVALLYMLSFLDRSSTASPICQNELLLIVVDIGNAKIAGLEKDLDLDSNKYDWVLTAFYLAYILFEWMSILWKIVPPHIYVTAIVLSWGIIASLQSVATSFAGLLVLRILLGIGEAGFTGIPFYLSFFFKREELALRTGFFISAAPLATSFASTLAYFIIMLGKYLPIASWRLLFLIEGFPSVLIAVYCWHIIPDSPDTATYLTKREKKVARLRLRKEKDPNAPPEKRGLNLKQVLSALSDPKLYLTAFMFFFTNMAFSSLPVFLPTIIHEMGHTVLISQALSAPPYLLSFIIVIFTAYLSDKMQNRSYFVIFHALLSAAGYAFLALAGKMGLGIWWRYAGIYPAAIGFFSVITIIITWTINNQESESKQGTGFAMLQLIGQCGPLVGTRLYPEGDAPFYVTGMAVCAAAMVFVACLSGGLRVYLRWKNRVGSGEYGKIGDEGHTLVGNRGNVKEPFKYML
jgi:MFS family permease